MPVTPKQLEQIRQLGREARDKQVAFTRKWHTEQQRTEKVRQTGVNARQMSQKPEPTEDPRE